METPQPPNIPHNPSVRYEERDVRFTPLALFGAGLAVLIIVAVGAMAGLFGMFATQLERQPADVVSADIEHIEHQLQSLREREDQLMSSYEWIDKEQRIVRIPIERAMDIVIAEQPRGSDGQ